MPKIDPVLARQQRRSDQAKAVKRILIEGVVASTSVSFANLDEDRADSKRRQLKILPCRDHNGIGRCATRTDPAAKSIEWNEAAVSSRNALLFDGSTDLRNENWTQAHSCPGMARRLQVWERAPQL